MTHRLLPVRPVHLFCALALAATGSGISAQVPAPGCEPPPVGAPSEWIARSRATVGMRDGEILHFKSVYRQAMNFQSDRPDPPFFSGYDLLETWFDPGTGVDRSLADQVYVGSGWATPRGFVTDERTTWAETSNGLREIAPFHPLSFRRRGMNPWAVLHDWAERPNTRVVGLCPVRGEERVTLEAEGPWGPERLFLDAETALPVGTERLMPHVTWGQRLEQVVWTTWFQVGSGYMAASTHLLADGDVELERTLGFAEIVPSEGAPLPALPEQVAAATEDPWLRAWTATPPDTARISDDVVLLTHPAYNNVLVRVADTVFVLDAPMSEARARQDSAWAATLFPQAPNRVLVVTDLAWPHIGGVRFWVARGAAVVSHAWSEPFLRRLVDRRWTLAPDALEEARARAELPLRFSAVARATRIGSSSILLAPIDGRASEGAILAFLPSARFLWAGDFVQNVKEGTAYARDVIAAVGREAFLPDRFAAQHLPITPWRSVMDVNPRATEGNR